MSDVAFPEEAEILKQEIFRAISRLEQLGDDVLEDQVLCHAISNLRGTALRIFSDMSLQTDVEVIDALMTEVFREVTGLQDRVIAAMEGSLCVAGGRGQTSFGKALLH